MRIYTELKTENTNVDVDIKWRKEKHKSVRKRWKANDMHLAEIHLTEIFR